MKIAAFTLSVLLTFSALPSQAGNFGYQQIKGKGREAAILRQLNLSQPQIAQINSIKRSEPRGRMKHNEILSVLTQSQREQYRMLMKRHKHNHGYGHGGGYGQQQFGSYGPPHQQYGSYGPPQQQNGSGSYGPPQQQNGSYGSTQQTYGGH